MKDLYERIVNLNNLYNAWDKVKLIANDDYIYNSYEVRNFNENIDSILLALNHSLSNKSFVFEKLHKLETPKKNGGKRVFHISTLTNAIVTQAILNNIGPVFERLMVAESYGYRLDLQSKLGIYKDWSAQYNEFSSNLLKWHKLYNDKDYTILKYDLKGFFDNVNLAIMYSMLDITIKDSSLCNLLNKYLNISIIDTPKLREKGLPQGVYSSGFFANVYLTEFDKTIRSKAIGYARYVDDLFILVENTNMDEMKSLVDKELSLLKLELNNDKYDEVSIDNFDKLLNIINKLKYETLDFVDTQSENLSDSDKENLFNYVESLILDKKDIPFDELEDCTEHINYLLFLNKKLETNNLNPLHIALQVLKREPVKYGKLEKIYNNLFKYDIASEYLLERITEYPDYIKISLAKFLLTKNEYSYSVSFVNSYLNSQNYLLVTSGLLLATRANYDFDLSRIIQETPDTEYLNLIFRYSIKCFMYEGRDILDEQSITNHFMVNPYSFMSYVHTFLKQPKISQSLLIEASKNDILILIYLCKILFTTAEIPIYDLMKANFDTKLILSLIKQEIILNLYSPTENSKNNIEKIVNVYKEIEFYTDELSKLITEELKFYINDYQIINNVKYIHIDTERFTFIEDIIFENKMCRVLIEGNDIEYWQVVYDSKRYVLEKVKKDFFKGNSDYNKYINYLNILKDNNLAPTVIAKRFTNNKYIYILYEVSDFNDLLWTKLKNGESFNIHIINEITLSIQKLSGLIAEPAVVSAHNVLMENDEPKFICVISQFKHGSYLSCCGHKRDISTNKYLESIGYLIIDCFNPTAFLLITKDNKFNQYFEYPHISTLLNKVFTKDKDFSYKHIEILLSDITYITRFSLFADKIKDSNPVEYKKVIALDYLGYRTIQFKRYLNSIEQNYLNITVDSFEKIIRNFNSYLESNDLYFDKSLLKGIAVGIWLRQYKVNMYSISIVLFIVNIYQNAKHILNKYASDYSFDGLLQFINHAFYILSYTFEMETRLRYDNELATTTSPQIKNTYNTVNSVLNSEIPPQNAEFNYLLTTNSSLYSTISYLTNYCKTKELKYRYYGTLLASGIALCDTNTEEVNAKLYKYFYIKKQKLKISKIDKSNSQYLRLVNNPRVSMEYLRDEIVNVNIESIAVANYLRHRKPKKKVKLKVKSLFISFIKFSAYTAIFTYIVHLFTNNYVGAIIPLLTVVYKELIAPQITSIKNNLR